MTGLLRAIRRPYSVLLSDHEEEARGALARAFETSPYETIVVSRGWEAIEIVQKRPVDVLVLDIEMPDLGGLSMVKVLKGLELAVPCVFTSYSFSKEMLIQAMIADVYSVFEKPIDLELVRTVVEDIIRKFHSEG